jgi:hypothetical protein
VADPRSIGFSFLSPFEATRHLVGGKLPGQAIPAIWGPIVGRVFYREAQYASVDSVVNLIRQELFIPEFRIELLLQIGCTQSSLLSDRPPGCGLFSARLGGTGVSRAWREGSCCPEIKARSRLLAYRGAEFSDERSSRYGKKRDGD